MNDNNIRKAMYALPDGVIACRRKPILNCSLLLAAGLLMVFFSDLGTDSLPADLSFGILSLGVILTLVGGLILTHRLTRCSAPCLRATGEYLIHREYGFDLKNRKEILAQLAAGDIEGLVARKESHVHSLIVNIYRTADNSFAAVQVFEYTDLSFRPATDIRIFRR